jgi:uncharacterized protein YaaR (DUF327 family)
MPSKAAEIIDLADDDMDDEFESIPIPDDIEEIEAMPIAGPSKRREVKTEKTGSSDYFDKRQSIDAKLAKLDVEVRRQ